MANNSRLPTACVK